LRALKQVAILARTPRGDRQTDRQMEHIVIKAVADLEGGRAGSGPPLGDEPTLSLHS